MATSKIKTNQQTFSRTSTSVFTYARSLPDDGIFFYSTNAGTADNPSNGSFMFIISKAGGISILGLMTGARAMFYTASANASDFDAWQRVDTSNI